jgi:hypothetical protein
MLSEYPKDQDTNWTFYGKKEEANYGERLVKSRDEVYGGFAEFRIPILPTVNNIMRAEDVILEFLKTAESKGIPLPKLLKVHNIQEAIKEGLILPETGPELDQRGKELCFYVTWEKDGELGSGQYTTGAPHLTVDEYKKFMLHMVKALYDGGVEGIGYYPSLNADRRFTLPDGTPAFFATYLENVTQTYNVDTGLQIIPKGDDKLLFYKEEVFAKHGSKNPLREIEISQQDLADAGLTPEILQKIENNHKQYIWKDFPQRLELLGGKLEEAAFSGSMGSEPKDELKKNHASLRKECLGLLEVPALPNILDWNSAAPNREELLTNACKHLATEAREFRAIASPIIKRLKDGYKTHDIEKFAKTAEEVFGEMNPSLADAQKDAVKEKARYVFTEILGHVQSDKEPMSILRKFIDWFVSLFGYGVENKRLGEAHTDFVSMVIAKDNPQNTGHSR